MICQNCKTQLPQDAKFCSRCGSSQKQASEPELLKGKTGYSQKIGDPAFAKYIQNANRWAGIFSVIIAAAAVIGFVIYGEISSEMDNPQSLYIGCGIGGMFLVIGLAQIFGRKRSKTWDGVVTDKKVEKKRRKKSTGDNDYDWEDYTVYNVFIRSDSGKLHTIRVENDSTVYNYYQMGDRVRHHPGLNSYEKYDKSKDDIIFCAACASLNDIGNDFCTRCKCPLLK